MKYKPSNLLCRPCGYPLEALFPWILLLAKIASMLVRSVCVFVCQSVRLHSSGHSFRANTFKFTHKFTNASLNTAFDNEQNPDHNPDTGIFLEFS